MNLIGEKNSVNCVLRLLLLQATEAQFCREIVQIVLLYCLF